MVKLSLHLFVNLYCCIVPFLMAVNGDSNVDEDLPLYWGWFVEEDYSSTYLNLSRKLLADTLQEVPDFLEDVQSFTQKKYISDILLYYTRENPTEVLHCTAMFNGVYPNYTPGAQEYAQKEVVKENVNHVSAIHAIGWILTPRTFGARVKLTEDQLLLWNQDDTEGNPKKSTVVVQTNSPSILPHEELFKKENTTDQDPDVMGNYQPTSGFGSKAHLTLGCAPGIGAVTTGYDLVDIIQLEGLNSTDIKTYNLAKGGWLRNYGEGQWVFYPTKQWLLESTFQGYDSGSSSGAPCTQTSLSLFLLSSIFLVLFSNKH